MTPRPKFRFLVSAHYSDFVEAATEDDAIDLLAARLLEGGVRAHEVDWAIEETESTDELPE